MMSHLIRIITVCNFFFFLTVQGSIFMFQFSRACGATVVNRTDELKEEDIGTECGLFEIKKIGDE